MAGKAKGVSKDVMIALRLPKELHERIVAAAGERSVSEELRRRLAASFEAGPDTDAATAELVGAVVEITGHLRQDFAPWHENRFAFDVLGAALDKVLGTYRPAGDPIPTFNPAGIGGLFYGDEPKVDDVARVMAGMAVDQIRKGRKP